VIREEGEKEVHGTPRVLAHECLEQLRAETSLPFSMANAGVEEGVGHTE
jgi:hypothetical protein